MILLKSLILTTIPTLLSLRQVDTVDSPAEKPRDKAKDLKAAANKIRPRNGANASALMAHKQEYFKKIKAKQSSKSENKDEGDDDTEESTMSKTTLRFCGGLVLVIFLVGFLASVMQPR
jgi:hypothetical protein